MTEMTTAQIAAQISAGSGDARMIVAIVGAPGAGKSTLAAELAAQIAGSVVVPMDGFHLDNTILQERGLLARKGAPETFDAAGFAALMARLRAEDEVIIPLFDRGRDLAVAGAGVVRAEHRILLVEGNYLLLNRAPWAGLDWDMTIWLEVPIEVLESRLIARWEGFGLTRDAAKERALGNDIPNARLVVHESRAADVVVHQDC